MVQTSSGGNFTVVTRFQTHTSAQTGHGTWDDDVSIWSRWANEIEDIFVDVNCSWRSGVRELCMSAAGCFFFGNVSQTYDMSVDCFDWCLIGGYDSNP